MDIWEYHKTYNNNSVDNILYIIYKDINISFGYIFEISDILKKIGDSIRTSIQQKKDNNRIYVEVIHPDTNEKLYVFINVTVNKQNNLFNVLCCGKNIDININCIICKPDNQRSHNKLNIYIANSTKI